MNKYTILFVCFVMSLFISCTSGTHSGRGLNTGNGNKAYILKFSPDTGMRYYYDITRSSTYRLKVNDQKIDKQSRLNAGIYYNIGKDSSGNFTLTVQYDKIHLHTKNGNTEREEDADQPPNAFDPVSGILHALKDVKISALITPGGLVKSITGYQKIEASILSNIHIPNPASRSMVQHQLDQLIGSNLIKANLKQLFKFLPDSAVHVGGQWATISKQAQGITMNVKTIYTLKSVDQGDADITLESKMTSDNSAVDLMGAHLTADLKGRQKGKYEVEIKTGMLIKGKASSNIKGTLQMAGREVPITIESDVAINGRTIN